MPGKVKTKSGTCVLNEKTMIILDQNNPLIPLDGPLLLTDTIAHAVCRRRQGGQGCVEPARGNLQS